MKSRCPYCNQEVSDRFFSIHMFLKHGILYKRKSTIIPEGNMGRVDEKECTKRLKNSRKLISKGKYEETIELLKGIPENFSDINKVKFTAGDALARMGYILEGIRYMEKSGEFSEQYPFWLIEVGRIHDASILIKKNGNYKSLAKLQKILDLWKLEEKDLKEVQNDLYKSYILLNRRFYEDSLKITRNLLESYKNLYPAYVIGAVAAHYSRNYQLAEKIKKNAVKKFGKFPLGSFPKEEIINRGRLGKFSEIYSRRNKEVKLQCVLFYSREHLKGGIEEMMKFTENFNMDDAYIGGILKVGNSYALFEYLWGEIRIETELYSVRNYILSVFGNPVEEINYISPKELNLRIL